MRYAACQKACDVLEIFKERNRGIRMEIESDCDTMMNAMSDTTQKPAGETPEPAVRKKIKLPPYRGLQPAANARHKVHPPWITIGLTAFGILAIVAFVADTYNFSRKADAGVVVPKTPADLMLAVTTATNRYVDPDGRFTIAKPAGWNAWYGDTNVEYDARLEGPGRMVLMVVVGDAPGETIDNLKKTFAEMEQDQGRVTHIAETNFHGLRAISRFTRMDLNALRILDFMATSNTEFHLMGLIPREEYESHVPIMDALIDTLQPAASKH